MKKNLIIILSLIFVILACDKETATPYLEILNLEDVFPNNTATASENEYKLFIKSNHKWTANSEQEFIELTSISSEDSDQTDTLVIKVLTNSDSEDREFEITVTSVDIIESVKLIQSGKKANEYLLPNKVEILKSGGETSFMLSSEYGIPEISHLNSSSEWVNIGEMKSRNDEYTWDLTFEENNSSIQRVDSLKILSASGRTFYFRIYQEGNTFKINTASPTLERESSEFKINITTNVDYEIELPEWISLVSKTSEGNNFVTFSAQANDSKSTRTSKIHFSPEGLDKISLDINQLGYIVNAAQNLKVVSQGGLINFSIDHNTDVKLLSSPDWTTQVITKSLTRNEFSFEVEENKNNSDRVGQFTLELTGIGTTTINLTQDAVSDDNSWISKDIYRNSLFIRFTGTWCVNCPNMAKGIALAKEELPDRIIDYSWYNNSHTSVDYQGVELIKYYNVTEYPYGILDGKTDIYNYGSSVIKENILSDVNNTHSNDLTLTGVDIESSVNNGVITLNAKIYSKETRDYYVSALLVEDGIVTYQEGGGSDYVHNSVLKEYFTEPTGDKIRLEAGKSQYYNSYLEIPSSVQNIENCYIILYLLKFSKADEESCQEDEKPFVDNVVRVKLNENYKMKFETKE